MSGPERTRGDGDFERVAIPLDDGDALRDVLLAEHPHKIIEIGLGYGASALAIAEALVSDPDERTRHVIIDAFQDHFHDVGWNALVGAGVADICTLQRERSQLALPRLVSDGFEADAAFVDGSHIFHNVFVDLVFLRELVHPGGLIVLDDVQLPSIATAISYFEINAGWRIEPINRTSRLSAYRLPDRQMEPTYESFKAFGAASQR